MDLFELFENDRDERRRTDPEGEPQPRQKGVRGFFRRWMATFSDDDHDQPTDRKKRRDSDYGWD